MSGAAAEVVGGDGRGATLWERSAGKTSFSAGQRAPHLKVKQAKQSLDYSTGRCDGDASSGGGAAAGHQSPHGSLMAVFVPSRQTLIELHSR